MKVSRLVDILIVLVILFAIGIGVGTRFSYTNDTKDIETMERFKNTYISDSFYNVEETKKKYVGEKNFLLNYKFIEGNAEVIVKVKKLSSKQVHWATLSDIKVIEIYKGKELIKGEELKVYEEYFMFLGNNKFINIGGYVPMKDNNEYILFLESRYKDVKNRNEDQKRVFNLVEGTLGKYPIKKTIKNYGANKKYTYIQVEDYDIVSDEKSFVYYTDIHEKVVESIIN